MSNTISIIIPCYNCQNTIESTLDSIDDIGNNCEIICINDASKDNTLEVIKKYKEHSNKSIIVVDNPTNVGAGKSRNVGILKSTGDYLLFLDSDDELVNGAISKLIRYIKNDYDVIIFDAIINSKKKLKMFFSHKIKEGIIDKKKCFVYVRGCTCGKMYKRSLIINNSIQFGEIKINEDLVFTKKSIYVANSIFYTRNVFYNYKMRKASLMGNSKHYEDEFELIAYSAIKDFVQNDFEAELNSLYFLEVIYSRFFRFLRSRKKNGMLKKEFKNFVKKYDKKDIYYRYYNLKYKLVYLLLKVYYNCVS